jgi:hypothetical protein
VYVVGKILFIGGGKALQESGEDSVFIICRTHGFILYQLCALFYFPMFLYSFFLFFSNNTNEYLE